MYERPVFNYFREERHEELEDAVGPASDDIENLVLADTNLSSIKHSPEFATNKNPKSPTNRLCTSLLSRKRLAFTLRYAIAHLQTAKGPEKHVMRYPQIFATRAIAEMIDGGTRKGIVWHTQGSGKTALAFYNVHFLTDYFRARGTVPKFYFIVDRIDLLNQASREFRSRGLVVHTINSRDAFAAEIKSKIAVHNDSGRPEITVVNIQRFKDDPSVVGPRDYAIDLQRVYFLDEVHRSYNPSGSFLANLNQSDTKSIQIGLTGTPLLGAVYKSANLFGGYIHTYYYNASIADGYTLRLIREEIETKYKLQLREVLDRIKVLESPQNREHLYAHPKFVEPMLEYILENLESTRVATGDPSIGAMVICDSSSQAKEMHRLFVEKRSSLTVGTTSKATTCALILHDVGTKKERKTWVEEFKDGSIDLLFVYNMLLTGFDAARLKKLYLGRIVRAHNLLQALTRVNRPYRAFRYGYVVDFVDIEKEFEKTNQSYFDELRAELGDELEKYSELFKSEAEILSDVESIKDTLFSFDTQNAEVFSQQISQIGDRSEMRAIVKALNDAKALYNIIRGSGRHDLLEMLDFRKLQQLATEANNHLALLNQREALENEDDTVSVLNIALEDVLFTFRKVSEEELLVADELRSQLRRTREGLRDNFDHADPKFVSLRQELERLFRKKNLAEISRAEMEANIAALKGIQDRAAELERRNQLLRAKYANDAKYARIHKRLLEQETLTMKERRLFEALSALKVATDARVVQNGEMLRNRPYAAAEVTKLIFETFETDGSAPLAVDTIERLRTLMMKEYLGEYEGSDAA